MSSLSIVSPERRIELNPFDTRPIDQVRSFYEKLVTQFPNAGRYWKAYIDHETRPIDQVRSFYEKLVTQFPNAGRYWKAYIDHELFGRCLIHVLNIDLWKCYVFYVRETKGHLSSFRFNYTFCSSQVKEFL
ncbi:unnamed protein product [Gongylonema pulchrum]|uniref:Suppressor of forked domain-containing protein n=1 Tax=Gongylonema pulchrum TaxID=637853 RepID=A0A183EDM8_9BILA|nr:unnamed protein product [Gongylonema pulchrum]